MKTRCYCILCKNHPLHDKRNELELLTGWDVDEWISNRFEGSGQEVECLEPASGGDYLLEDDLDCFSYPITAYNDGFALTGFEESGVTLRGYCEGEDYEE